MARPSCSPAQGLSLAAAFNRDCRCIIVGEPALAKSLEAALPAHDRAALPDDAHDSLFSATGIFLAREDVDHLRSLITAFERAIATASFRTMILNYANVIARIDHGPHGVCMGYNFHLTDAGPKLIETDTSNTSRRLREQIDRQGFEQKKPVIDGRHAAIRNDRKKVRVSGRTVEKRGLDMLERYLEPFAYPQHPMGARHS